MERIMDKSKTLGKRKIQFEDNDFSVDNNHLESLKKEVKFEYALHMQKNIVLTQMKIPSNHAMFKK
jgi:hypothetical protein